MEGFYVFSDECGGYIKKRSRKYVDSHPFYVRASVTIDFYDYIKLEQECAFLKERLSINPGVEIKWAETGQRFNNRVSHGMEQISDDVLFRYIENVIEIAVKLNSVKLFFSVFDNRVDKEIEVDKMLKMHLQNALQRANMDGNERNAFMTLIMDDVGDKTNKRMKEIIHAMMMEGDFQKYDKVKKSILIDYSHHCVGLQLADFSAGIFNNCLKRLSSNNEGYDYANRLFFDYLYDKVRKNDSSIPYYSVYRFGIKEVPNDCGSEICKHMSELISEKLTTDLLAMVRDE